MSTFCTECGTTFDATAAAFCGACGTKRPTAAGFASPPMASATVQGAARSQSAAPSVQPVGQYPDPSVAVAYQPHSQVAAKNPALAVICSFFIPGLGQLINGQAGKGIGLFVGYTAAQVAFWITIWFILGIIFLPVILGLWIWGMVDAHSAAKNWNARHGIIS